MTRLFVFLCLWSAVTATDSSQVRVPAAPLHVKTLG